MFRYIISIILKKVTMKEVPREEPKLRIKRIIPPIPDTPENVALAIMQGPPKKEWEFLNKGTTKKR